jgi:hypothetical protein
VDQELRELERRFDAAPEPMLAQQLVHAYARHGDCAPPRVLWLTERWRPLVEFVTRWYERPLADDDGCSESELRAAEERIGARLPTALMEWFRLVSRRLEDVQDSPARLDRLGADNGLVPVWIENQGNWVIRAPTDQHEEDPEIVIDEESRFHGRLVETLLGMATSDTLVGAWCGHGRGPLGALSDGVCGGQDNALGPDAIESHYPLLSGPGDPFCFEPAYFRARGDGATVVRCNGAGLEWMTANDEAFARLSPILHLEEGTEFDLLIRFERLPRVSRNADPYGVFASLGIRPRMGRLEGASWCQTTFSTDDPRALFERVRAALPPGAEAHLAAGFRSRKIARFTSLWPPGQPRFRPFP